MSKTKGTRPAGKIRKVLRAILVIVLVVVAAAAILVGVLTAAEYRPADEESLAVEASGQVAAAAMVGQTYRIATWNIGYGALGDNADFFMDGGTMVNTADSARLEANLQGISEELGSLSPDFIFLQEVDRNSARSHRVDEAERILSATGLSSTFAYNFRVLFIPYPIPPIGQVNSGILTLSDVQVTESVRLQLPCPFSWPVRVANLKRCLMVDRLPVTDAQGNDTGKELVLINLHLEAYDSGEGKIRQTQMLRQVLEEEVQKGNYVIAGGDFNQTFSGTDDSMYPAYEGTWQCGEIDENDFPESLQFLMDNSVPTCRSLDQSYAGKDPEHFQFYMIDGFIVSDNITVNQVETEDLQFVCSDHNPVVMDFVLR